MSKVLGVIALLLFAGFGRLAVADTIQIGGNVTQSTQDGTSPAINNPSLGNLADGDAWTLSLTFDGSIAAPGSYNNLANASLTFNDLNAGASETDFGSISLAITQVGGFDNFSLFGCLNTGSGCALGNQLSASFQIADADFNSLNAAATGMDQPHPLDLLEDDGTTDIQGSIGSYSYAAQLYPTPEPSTFVLLGEGLTLLCAGYLERMRRNNMSSQKRRGL
jgi:hypothetical protein